MRNNKNTNIFIRENAFENVCKMKAILSKPEWLKTMIFLLYFWYNLYKENVTGTMSSPTEMGSCAMTTSRRWWWVKLVCDVTGETQDLWKMGRGGEALYQRTTLTDISYQTHLGRYIVSKENWVRYIVSTPRQGSFQHLCYPTPTPKLIGLTHWPLGHLDENLGK